MKKCSKCKENKSIDNFIITKRGYYSWCRDCSNKKCREYKRLNKEKLRDYWRIYRRNKYYIRRKESILLLGGKCVVCNSVDRLEIDHTDRKTKIMETDRFPLISYERYREELSKCQLLCRKCHIEKTVKSKDYLPKSW